MTNRITNTFAHQNSITAIDSVANLSKNTNYASTTSGYNINISIIITVLIFFLGFIISNLIEKYKKKRELELYKLLIVELVNDSKKDIEQYIESLRIFAQEVKKSDSLNIALYHSNVLCFEKLSSLPLEKITDALLVNLKVRKKENKATKHLFNLIRQLEFLEKNAKLITINYEKYLKQNELLLDEWNKYFIELTKNIGSNYIDITTSEPERQFYDHSKPIQMKIVDIQKQNIAESKSPEVPRSKIMNEFINPVYEYGKQNSGEFSSSSKIQETMMMLHEVKMVNMKYNNHIKFGNLFERMNEEMIKAKTILYETIEYYENHDIKSFWETT